MIPRGNVQRRCGCECGCVHQQPPLTGRASERASERFLAMGMRRGAAGWLASPAHGSQPLTNTASTVDRTKGGSSPPLHSRRRRSNRSSRSNSQRRTPSPLSSHRGDSPRARCDANCKAPMLTAGATPRSTTPNTPTPLAAQETRPALHFPPSPLTTAALCCVALNELLRHAAAAVRVAVGRVPQLDLLGAQQRLDGLLQLLVHRCHGAGRAK